MSVSVSKGYRFRPTDEELVDYFLPKKLKGKSFQPILDRTMYGDKLPWEIFTDDDPTWEYEKEPKPFKKTVYTFTKLTAMGTNNYVRTAGSGTWDGKSRTQVIKNSRGKVIGRKRQFRFRPEKDENKGRWIMHEYTSALVKSDYALCKITVDGFQVSKDCFSSDVGCSTSSSDCDETRKRKYSCVVLDSEADNGIDKRARVIEEEENLKEKGDDNFLQIPKDGMSVIGSIPYWLYTNTFSENIGMLDDIALLGSSEIQQQEAIIPCAGFFDEDIMANTYDEDIALLGSSEIQQQEAIVPCAGSYDEDIMVNTYYPICGELLEAIIPCAGSYGEDIMANTYYPSCGELLDAEGYGIRGQDQQFPETGHVLDEERTQQLQSTQTMDPYSMKYNL